MRNNPMCPISFDSIRLAHSPLVNKLHKLEIAGDERLKAILDLEYGNDLTKDFLDDLRWRAENNHNHVTDIKGPRGSGKSTLARGIKCFCDKVRGIKTSIEDIVFTRDEYMKRYGSGKRGQTFIIDEDFGFQTQTGSVRIRESMMLAEQTFRIEEISTISCSVANSYAHLYDFSLLSYDYDAKNGINRAIVNNTAQLNSYFARPVGYILFPTRKYLNPELEKHYQDRKKEFTKKVKEGKVRTLQEDYDAMAEQCIRKFKWNMQKPTERVMKVYLSREYPHMANTEQTDILDTLVVRMYEIHGSSKDASKKKNRDA